MNLPTDNVFFFCDHHIAKSHANLLHARRLSILSSDSLNCIRNMMKWSDLSKLMAEGI